MGVRISIHASPSCKRKKQRQLQQQQKEEAERKAQKDERRQSCQAYDLIRAGTPTQYRNRARRSKHLSAGSSALGSLHSPPPGLALDEADEHLVSDVRLSVDSDNAPREKPVALEIPIRFAPDGEEIHVLDGHVRIWVPGNTKASHRSPTRPEYILSNTVQSCTLHTLVAHAEELSDMLIIVEQLCTLRLSEEEIVRSLPFLTGTTDSDPDTVVASLDSGDRPIEGVDVQFLKLAGPEYAPTRRLLFWGSSGSADVLHRLTILTKGSSWPDHCGHLAAVINRIATSVALTPHALDMTPRRQAIEFQTASATERLSLEADIPENVAWSICDTSDARSITFYKFMPKIPMTKPPQLTVALGEHHSADCEPTDDDEEREENILCGESARWVAQQDPHTPFEIHKCCVETACRLGPQYTHVTIKYASGPQEHEFKRLAESVGWVIVPYVA